MFKQAHIVLVFSMLVFLLFSCGNGQEKIKDENQQGNQEYKKIPIKYARAFSLNDHGEYLSLKVTSPWKGAKTSFEYILYPREGNIPSLGKGKTYISVPIKSSACLSTTHIGFLKALGKENLINAVTAGRFIYDEEIKKAVDKGRIAEVGDQKQLNYEKLVEVSPDIILSYGIDQSSIKTLDKLEELGQKSLVIAEYMENDPLGKAEWLLVFGALTADLDKARSLFEEIENRYETLRKRANEIEDQPTVFTGIPWKGVWYVPGGNSFQAKLFEDSGADYIWKENEETSGVGLNTEIVFDKALSADYWLNLSNYKELAEISSMDKRFEEFDAFSKENLFNNNKRLNSSGGNDYWESGVVKPHIILKDLIRIFHPELLPDHKLYYYQKLH